MSEGTERTRAAIVAAVAQALAEIYFAEVCSDPQPSADDLLQTAARMRALHEAIQTARDLLGILDKAAALGAADDAPGTGVVVLPETTGTE